MGKLLFVFLTVIILTAIYVFGLYMLLNVDFNYDFINNNVNEVTDGSSTKIPFSDSVSVSVKKERWYGTIYENDGNSDLHISFIKIPLKYDGVNYFYLHLFFIFVMLIFITFILSINT